MPGVSYACATPAARPLTAPHHASAPPPPITTSLCTTFLAHPSIEVPPPELLPQVRHRRRPVARCAHSPRPRRECQGDDALAKGSGRSNEDRGLPGHLAGQLARVQLLLTALLNGIRRFVRREDGVALVRNLRAIMYKFCAAESRKLNLLAPRFATACAITARPATRLHVTAIVLHPNVTRPWSTALVRWAVAVPPHPCDPTRAQRSLRCRATTCRSGTSTRRTSCRAC